MVVAVCLAGCGGDDSDAATAAATSAAPSPTLPVVPTNGSVPVGEPYQIEVGTHCGVGYFALPVNGTFWITDSAGDERYWMPSEWANSLGPGDDLLTVQVELSDHDTMTATAEGRSVVYRPVTDSDPIRECA